MKVIFIYCSLILMVFVINLQSSENNRKLYISKINILPRVPEFIKTSIVNRIKLNLIENFGDKYYIVSDSDVALMNKKAAELQLQGCDANICMKQIADAIDADEIIYGDVLMEGEKVRIQLTNINRDKTFLNMSTKSIADVSFFESQYDHFIHEATFKLLDPNYKINTNLIIKADDTISLKKINLSEVDALDISIIEFKSNDITINNILDYLKEEVKKGDELYNKKVYVYAYVIYQSVLDRISNSITKDKRAKIKEFEKSIMDRIGSTHVMEKKIQIDSYDRELSQLNTLSEEKIRQILKGYKGIKEFIKRDLEVQYQYRFTNIDKDVDERIDTLELALTRFLESKGDTYYKENQFDQTFKAYTEAIVLLESQRNQKIELIQRLQKKIATNQKTGENYLKNSVKTYLNQAEYMNLLKKTEDAKYSLSLAKKLIESSMFAVPICVSWYSEVADLLGFTDKVKINKITNSIGMEFVLIPAGEFMMGCSPDTFGCSDYDKPHKVRITKSYYLGKFEVTQGQWKVVMGKNPSYFKKCGDTCPVENVSWNDIQEFISKLCKKERLIPCKYRLPTEAEWEYAARGGTNTTFYWGLWIEGANESYLWHNNNSGNTTHPVGKKMPNAWGLYDMSGNISEWVQDWNEIDYYMKSPENDPRGPNTGELKVIRGGAWYDYPLFCQLGGRLIKKKPVIKNSRTGFRLLLIP